MCGLNEDKEFAPGWRARLRTWLIDGQAPPSKLVCANGHQWPAESTALFSIATSHGWWRWPSRAMRVLIRHRTAEPVPLFWMLTTLVGVVLGLAAELSLGWSWWLVSTGWLVLVWLVFLATALRPTGREDLRIDLVGTVSPQRAQRHEMQRLLRLVETGLGPVYGLAEWDGPRHVGGHGRSSSQGLTHLEVIYGSPLDDEPNLRVDTIWKGQHQPDIQTEHVRDRFTRELWHRRVRPPAELDPKELHQWMRQQGVEIDRRPIPDWAHTSISVDGTLLDAEVYREGEDWIAVVDVNTALIHLQSHCVAVDSISLAPVTDLKPWPKAL